MNVNQIKSDGRVILLADSSVKGATPYNIVNRASNNTNPNVEGNQISMIASGKIGETNKALTFRQNGMEKLWESGEWNDEKIDQILKTDFHKQKQPCYATV